MVTQYMNVYATFCIPLARRCGPRGWLSHPHIQSSWVSLSSLFFKSASGVPALPFREQHNVALPSPHAHAVPLQLWALSQARILMMHPKRLGRPPE
jgi:hypothetical protein